MSGEKPASTLRNGNPRRDLATLPCCGARTRLGLECRQPSMRNGRCRFHGGKSTGARTEEGRARQVAANTRHGMYGDAGRRLTHLARALRISLRLMRQGVYPTGDHATFGDWIGAQMAPPPPPEPDPRPVPPQAPILHALSPPLRLWRHPSRYPAPACARLTWPPKPRSALPRAGPPYPNHPVTT